MYRIIPKNRFISPTENIDEEDVGLFDERNMATHGMNRNLQRDIPLFFDNLKVVQRRLLFAMAQMGLRPRSAMEKSAGVVGETIKKYHPHGDQAAYKALIYMRQPWRHLLPLIEVQGNYGNAENPDAHASMRYTEVRLSEFAWDCFFSEWDLKSELVDMKPTFNGRDYEPVYLPAKYPLFLMGWGSGIGYGISTKSPGFLPQDVMQAVITLIDDKDAKLTLYPEDPLGCTIIGRKVFRKFVDYDMSDINDDTLTFKVRANYRVEGNRIIVYNAPFEVNPATVIERIVSLVNNNKLEGLENIDGDLQVGPIPQLGEVGDTADIWIDFKRGYDPHVLMEKIYKATDLESTFSLNCVYVDMNKNVRYNLRQGLLNWISMRRKVLKRMYRLQLNKDSMRKYVLDALIMLFERNSIDKVIDIIRNNKRSETAEMLIKEFKISDYQAKQISAMRIIDLSPDSYDEYVEERKKVMKEIDKLQKILKKRKYIDNIIKDQMREGIKKYSRKRISKVIEDTGNSVEESIHTICVTDTSFVKRLPEDVINPGTIAEDSKVVYLEHGASSLDKLFMFTPQGRTYSEFIHKMTPASEDTVGLYLRRKLRDDRINIVSAVTGSTPTKSNLVFVTKKGMVKQTKLDAYFIASQGSVGIRLVNGDELVKTIKVDSNKDRLLIFTKNGNCVLFNSQDVTITSRTTVGVTGIKLDEGDEVIGVITVKPSDTHIVTMSERGEFKRFSLDAALGSMKRADAGVSIVSTSEKIDHVFGVGAKDTKIQVITEKQIEEVNISDIPVKTRLSNGDRLVKLGRGNRAIHASVL